MQKVIPFLFLLAAAGSSFAQQGSLKPLTVEKIMRDPEWIGTSPSNPYWSSDSKYLLFQWNPEKAPSDSLYYITPSSLQPQKAGYTFRQSIITESNLHFNKKMSQYVYSERGDIFLTDAKTGKTIQITNTVDYESNPQFSFNDSKVIYTQSQNLYAWDIQNGNTTQLTNFSSTGSNNDGPPSGRFGGGGGNRGGGQTSGRRSSGSDNDQDSWLGEEAIANSMILQERLARRELQDSMRRLIPRDKSLRSIPTSGKSLFGTSISHDGRFITYRLFKSASGGRSTIIPNYVTESGFTEDIRGRTKVGTPQSTQELYVYDTEKDTIWEIKASEIPGIKDIPEYFKDYPAEYEKLSKKPPVRGVNFQNVSWSPGEDFGVVEVHSQDNKDRWLLLLEADKGTVSLLDRQHDEAWIGGPGTSGFRSSTGWISDEVYWYQSEVTGYSHLYTVNIKTKEKKALTSGNYEVQSADLSKNKKYFYITTNEVHPGEKQFYRLPVNGGKAERITTLSGANQVSMSPDEKYLAILYSYSNKPWELYLQENKPGGKLQQVTNLAESDEFKSYPWRDPGVVTFKARDGAEVYARLYQPANPHPSKPAVIFVHGAGYLQNAHKWWSSYSREYMFHNLLADNGYTVLDIDYRGSAGYGRDWRTGIYRFMGGKDLTDQVDGAKWLVEKYGVDPKHIGLYGGSYGGFITLMAMFTTPDVFASGAALRSVTDWAHYNHGYTSNILNEPVNDSIAYYRSSPINFADGLKGNLLMCHGMVDVNVHFQDIVRLTQKLIELKKDNWELAVYPVEDHGFVEPTSWTDEYKRIFKLFETTLKTTAH